MRCDVTRCEVTRCDAVWCARQSGGKSFPTSSFWRTHCIMASCGVTAAKANNMHIILPTSKKRGDSMYGWMFIYVKENEGFHEMLFPSDYYVYVYYDYLNRKIVWNKYFKVISLCYIKLSSELHKGALCTKFLVSPSTGRGSNWMTRSDPNKRQLVIWLESYLRDRVSEREPATPLPPPARRAARHSRYSQEQGEHRKDDFTEILSISRNLSCLSDTMNIYECRCYEYVLYY